MNWLKNQNRFYGIKKKSVKSKIDGANGLDLNEDPIVGIGF